MKQFILKTSIKDWLIALSPIVIVGLIILFGAYKHINPAPPRHLVISTGDSEGSYYNFAQKYKEIMKESGIDLEIKTSSGTLENLQKLQDEDSEVEVGFVQDGISTGTEDDDLVSLGSVYYEPIWIFYSEQSFKNSNLKPTRLSDLKGKRIAIGRSGGGTQNLSIKLLKASGIDNNNSKFLELGWSDSLNALKNHQADIAFFLTSADDDFVTNLFNTPGIRLLNMDQAEASVRQFPFLHHLVLPHGAFDLKTNQPIEDIHLLAPTATLVAKSSLHPALIYLLLKAASEVHGDPGLFEKKKEFPSDKDYNYPLATEAKLFYKSGSPFLQRYLPFWIANLIERFLFLIIPTIALILPILRLVPAVYKWRVRNRIYKRYGELKFLENQIKSHWPVAELEIQLKKIDQVESDVNQMKLPLEFAEHLYGLRVHIDYVRRRIHNLITAKKEV